MRNEEHYVDRVLYDENEMVEFANYCLKTCEPGWATEDHLRKWNELQFQILNKKIKDNNKNNDQ